MAHVPRSASVHLADAKNQLSLSALENRVEHGEDTTITYLRQRRLWPSKHVKELEPPAFGSGVELEVHGPHLRWVFGLMAPHRTVC